MNTVLAEIKLIQNCISKPCEPAAGPRILPEVVGLKEAGRDQTAQKVGRDELLQRFWTGRGLRVRVEGSGLRGQGLGFRGLGFRV